MSEIDHDRAFFLAEEIDDGLSAAKSSLSEVLLLLTKYDQDDEAYLVPNQTLAGYLESRGVDLTNVTELILAASDIRDRLARIRPVPASAGAR